MKNSNCAKVNLNFSETNASSTASGKFSMTNTIQASLDVVGHRQLAVPVCSQVVDTLTTAFGSIRLNYTESIAIWDNMYFGALTHKTA